MEGENVAGMYRQRITLFSGRFAMIDAGMGFQFVPWRPALEQQLAKQVAGVTGWWRRLEFRTQARLWAINDRYV